MELKEIIHQTLSFLQEEKVILYPTDTIWGLGCDAFSLKAIQRIQQIKQRPLAKSFILLVSSKEMLERYVRVPAEVVAFLARQERPTSVVYTEVYDKHLPIAEDSSLAFRIVQDDFCKQLIEAFGRPLVSTSANISGEPSAATFAQIAPEVQQAVDFVVPYDQENQPNALASQLVKWQDGQIVYIRR
jgi:sua5/yciO/yrdC/ywlC family protein